MLKIGFNIPSSHFIIKLRRIVLGLEYYWLLKMMRFLSLNIHHVFPKVLLHVKSTLKRESFLKLACGLELTEISSHYKESDIAQFGFIVTV